MSLDSRIALASRRLAILDLSPAGAQPMASADGRHHLVMNGEIYNFRELRRGWSGWRRLPLLERHRGRPHPSHPAGCRGAPRLRGMFGLAFWDDREKRLLLARDPLGIKPLYLSTEGGCLRFASQVKALEAGGAVSRAVDPAGLAGFLLWGSVPEPFTIRSAVRALPAGHCLIVEDDRTGEPTPLRQTGARSARFDRSCQGGRGVGGGAPGLGRPRGGLPLRRARLGADRRAGPAPAGRAADHVHPALRRARRDSAGRGTARGRGGPHPRHPPRGAAGRPRRLRRRLACGARGHGPAEHRRLQHLRESAGPPRRPGSRSCCRASAATSCSAATRRSATFRRTPAPAPGSRWLPGPALPALARPLRPARRPRNRPKLAGSLAPRTKLSPAPTSLRRGLFLPKSCRRCSACDAARGGAAPVPIRSRRQRGANDLPVRQWNACGADTWLDVHVRRPPSTCSTSCSTTPTGPPNGLLGRDARAADRPPASGQLATRAFVVAARRRAGKPPSSAPPHRSCRRRCSIAPETGFYIPVRVAGPGVRPALCRGPLAAVSAAGARGDRDMVAQAADRGRVCGPRRPWSRRPWNR